MNESISDGNTAYEIIVCWHSHYLNFWKIWPSSRNSVWLYINRRH